MEGNYPLYTSLYMRDNILTPGASNSNIHGYIHGKCGIMDTTPEVLKIKK